MKTSSRRFALSFRQLGLALVSLCLPWAAACVDPEATICPTGITCPSGARCALNQPVCILDGCGDGVLEGEEQCDDGNLVSGDGCSAHCNLEGCGNGIVDIALGERCDDGNTEDGDGCSADCRTNERCGNGILDADLGEVCDDGNNTSGDGCSADCLSGEICGNGYLDLVEGEECEASLPIPSGLMGVTCSDACRYIYAEGVTPQAAQCRLSIAISEGTTDREVYDEESGEWTLLEDIRLEFPGRIVSNKGGIDCVPGGADCTSDLIPCGEEVLLMVLPKDDSEGTLYELMYSIDWNYPECSPENGSGRIERALHSRGDVISESTSAFWCPVTLDAETPEFTLNIEYDDRECNSTADCDDGIDCTVDVCDLDTYECLNTPVDCCEPGSGWSGYSCSEPIDSVEVPAGTYESLAETLPMEAFRLARAPITVGEFNACVLAGACSVANFQSHSAEDTARALCNFERGFNWWNHPMNCVDWHGASEFCAWIGGRLPELTEWEYAALHDGEMARAVSYPWGDSAPGHCVHANYYSGDAAPNVYCSDLSEVAEAVGTSAIGTYSPAGDSTLGLQDMFGNVFEWTQTLSGANAATYLQAGGSYLSPAQPLTDISTARSADDMAVDGGFRCALAPMSEMEVEATPP